MQATPISPAGSPLRGPGTGQSPTLDAVPGSTNLLRGLLVSAILHAFAIAFALGLFDADRPSESFVVDRSVDVEIAPRPPKAEAPTADVSTSTPVDESEPVARPPTNPDRAPGSVAERRDAGVEEVDALPARKHRSRTRSDAGLAVASTDRVGDARTGDGSADRVGDARTADGAPDDGDPALVSDPLAIARGSIADAGLAVPPEVGGSANPPSVDPVPEFVGTSANLLAYFPPGQVVTALVRFDRLRDTEWAKDAEALLRPMPDYRALFGSRDAAIHNKIDMLAISSARPSDAKATTLVMKTALSRGDVRDLLANSAAPIAWSATGGGAMGKREGNDSRVLLSPWREWYLLAAPHDLPGLLAPAVGELDTIEAKDKLPRWISSIRGIEGESGNDTRGPALVVTMGRARSGSRASRYALPQFGLGVASLPVPMRASIAMELVKQGWVVRGTMRFATEGDASEFVQRVREVRQHVLDSIVLSTIVSRQHGRNALEGLSLLQSGTGVSYATSISISDARAVLPSIAAALADHFGSP